MSFHITETQTRLLAGKVGLVTGIANDQSIAYGCARALRDAGANLAITYLNDKAKPYVEPLSGALGAELFLPLDVARPARWRPFSQQFGRNGAVSIS
jgi:enoyl-[acyl-carrier protein] reductase I